MITKKIIPVSKELNKLILFALSECLDDEIWKNIYWLDERYYVSNKGRVLSLCNNKGKVLKPFIQNGYYYVSIAGHDRRIHRLVAQAFLQNPEAKEVVHHIDGNKLNNNVDNLQWATAKENTQAYHNSKKGKQTT